MKENFREFLLEKIDTFVVDALRFLELVTMPTIVDQVRRSVTSIGANVHEGQCANSRKEYARYLEIGLRSGQETSYWLFLIAKLDARHSTRASRLISQCDEIGRILYTSINSLKKPKAS